MLNPVAARGFMRCGVSGVAMSEDLPAENDTVGPFSDGQLEEPSEESLELAERIIVRLKPPSRVAISKMIHTKAKMVGGILAGYAVFWWLAVLQVDDETVFTSIFFGPDFLAITIIAPALIFLGSLFENISRELGQLFPGLAHGIMFVMAVLYTFEPLIRGLFMSDLDSGDAIWKTSRLAILCLTILIAARMLIDAWLLRWVKVFMENNPDLDFSDTGADLGEVEDATLETEN